MLSRYVSTSLIESKSLQGALQETLLLTQEKGFEKSEKKEQFQNLLQNSLKDTTEYSQRLFSKQIYMSKRLILRFAYSNLLFILYKRIIRPLKKSLSLSLSTIDITFLTIFFQHNITFLVLLQFLQKGFSSLSNWGNLVR